MAFTIADQPTCATPLNRNKVAQDLPTAGYTRDMQGSTDDENNKQPRPLHIVQLSDFHLFAAGDGRLHGVDTGVQLERTLAAADAVLHRADLILLTGDLAEHGETETYRRLASRLEAYGRPVAALPGNHDDPDTLARHFQAPLRDSGVELALGRWRLLLLDTTAVGESWGRLGATRLAWLRERLAHASVRPVLVALHHPPLPLGSPWMDAIGLTDGDDLYACLKGQRQVRGVLFGHAHQPCDLRRGVVRYLGCPSTCVQFTPRTETVQIDDGPPGWRELTLRPDGDLATAVCYADEGDD